MNWLKKFIIGAWVLASPMLLIYAKYQGTAKEVPRQELTIQDDVHLVYCNGYCYVFDSPLRDTKYWDELNGKGMTVTEINNAISGIVDKTYPLPMDDKDRVFVKTLYTNSGEVQGVWLCPSELMTKNLERLRSARACRR